MRLGIVLPVVVRLPNAHDEWERDAGIDELGAIAETADRLGFHHLGCSEHVAVPAPSAEQRGGTYWDPLATFGYLAARTRRIRLATQVLVLGYHHPLAIAKRYGTLDQVSGGRLTLGVGVGSLQEEFELLDAPFADRGARADDALRALRSSLSRRLPEFHGEFHDFTDSGSAEAVAELWEVDGVYDVDTGRMTGHDEIAAMVRSRAHQSWITVGCAHVLGAPYVSVDGDHAVATCYSQLIVNDGGPSAFAVLRVTANHWRLRRNPDGWRVTTRTSRLLDGRDESPELLAAGIANSPPGYR